MITTPLRILLVENNTAHVDIIINNIHKIVETPQVKVVGTYKELASQLQDFFPDVVISDYNFPEFSGIEVLELTSSFDENFPLIFLTAAIEDEELAANTILAGATGFVLKKNMDILDQKLRPLLKKIVFNMGVGREIRDKVRRNKIVVNQIYSYLDDIKSDNEEQRLNLEKIKNNIRELSEENFGENNQNNNYRS